MYDKRCFQFSVVASVRNTDTTYAHTLLCLGEFPCKQVLVEFELIFFKNYSPPQ